MVINLHILIPCSPSSSHQGILCEKIIPEYIFIPLSCIKSKHISLKYSKMVFWNIHINRKYRNTSNLWSAPARSCLLIIIIYFAKFIFPILAIITLLTSLKIIDIGSIAKICSTKFIFFPIFCVEDFSPFESYLP